MNGIITLSFIFVSSIYAFGFKDSIIKIDEPAKKRINQKLYFFEDRGASLTFDEIKDSVAFQKLEGGTPNFGIRKGAFWFRLTIKNNSKDNLFLELAHPVLTDVHLYDPLKPERNPIRDGQNVPYSQKEIKSTNIVFDLNLKPGKTKTFYIMVKSQTQIQLPLYIGGKQELLTEDFYNTLFAALFAGLMFAMFSYNLAIYFIVRDISYLYYVLFVIVILIVQLIPKGFAYQYFWPEFPSVANASMFFAPAASGATAIFFFNSFLKVKHYVSKLRLFLFGLVGMYIIALMLYGLHFFSISYSILDTTSLVASFVMLGGAFYIYKKGNSSALFFLIAWSLFLIGVIVFVLKELGVFPHNDFTNYTMMIGSGIETILLSIGLADRINLLKKEKEEAQQKELAALLENDKLIKGQKEELEIKVKKRTKKLNEALNKIKKAQAKLIESEKMASIGLLTAGIAHEINNPINYITSNISSLHRDIDDVKLLIDAYSSLNEDNFSSKTKEIEEIKEEIEYDYLIKEIPTLLDGIKEGANRTANIVESLRSFSIKDRRIKVETDIAKGINASLTLLNNNLQGIKVEVDDQLKKPVFCFPGKLNQVIMNIISNAIHAIHEKSKQQDYQGSINISLFEKQNGQIIIQIKDNGIGMTEEVKRKIFDPFFTTKEVGSGTGLGMALTYQYIKLHEGDIAVDSTLGVGTNIIISFENTSNNE
jgi:signal transduction histidine kinase